MISSKFDYNLESERYRLPEYDILKKLAIEKQKSQDPSRCTSNIGFANNDTVTIPDLDPTLEHESKSNLTSAESPFITARDYSH